MAEVALCAAPGRSGKPATGFAGKEGVEGRLFLALASSRSK